MTMIKAVFPTKVSSMKPSKRKIVRTVYTTEKLAKSIQNDIPVEARGIPQAVSDLCKNIRIYLTKTN